MPKTIQSFRQPPLKVIDTKYVPYSMCNSMEKRPREMWKDLLIKLLLSTGCSSSLGMKSGLIKDHQLAASSSMSEFMLPSEGRLHNTM